MARRPESWYWQERKAWYVTIDSKRHCLADEKDDAYDEFDKLMTKRTDGSEKVLRLYGDSPRLPACRMQD